MPQAVPAGVAIAIRVVATVLSVSMASNARRKARKAAEEAAGISTMLKEAAASWQYVYGERRVSGPIVFVNETDENRRHLQLVVVLAPHEIYELKTLYFDDEVVTFNPTTGAITSKNYEKYGEIFVRLGAPGDTPPAMLINDNPGLWTAQHTLTGCAYVYVRLWWEQSKWFGGLPNISAVVRGKKLLDPRTGQTYWNANPALIAYDQMKDPYIGLGLSDDRIDLPSVIEAANVCEEQVSYVAPAPTDNTPFRYSCHYVADSAVLVDDRMEDILACMAGSLVRSSGKWFLRAGKYRAPTVTLTEADLLGPISVTPRRSKMDLCNRVRGKFLSIPTLYTATDFPPVSNATYLAQDDDEELWADIELPGTVDPVQAQRLAKIYLERNRQQISLQMPVGFKGLQLMPTDTVAVTLATYGWNSKVFEVVGWKLNFDTGDEKAPMAVNLTLQETASTVYTWNAEETVVDAAPDTNLPNPFDVPEPVNPTVTQAGVMNVDGTWTVQAKVAWDAIGNEYIRSGGSVKVRYKESTATDWIETPAVPGSAVDMILPALLIGLTYNVEVANVTYIGAQSDWTACDPAAIAIVNDTTAPAVPTDLLFLDTFYEGIPASVTLRPGYAVVAATLTWDDPSDYDLDYVEVLLTGSATTPTGGVIPPGNTNVYAVGPKGVDTRITRHPAKKQFATVFTPDAMVAGGVVTPISQDTYLYVRSVDLTGNKSAWYAYGKINTAISSKWKVALSQFSQAATDRLTVTGVQIGDTGATEVRRVAARFPFRASVTFTAAGGVNVAYANLDLTNRGFTAAPTGSMVVKDDTQAAYAGWTVLYSPALSSSTNAKLMLVAPANIPAGTYTFTVSGELVQWSS